MPREVDEGPDGTEQAPVQVPVQVPAPQQLPEHDHALRDRLGRLVGVLRRAALARTRPVRHTRAHLAALRLVEVADQSAVRRPTPASPEILRVGRDDAHAATFDALFDLHRLAADAPETVELVLAGGLLHVPGGPDVRSTQDVHVHLVSQPVRVERDPRTGEMVAAIVEEGVGVADDELLGDTALLDLRAAAARRAELADAVVSPLDPALTGALTSWAPACLTVEVDVGDDWIAPGEDDPVARLVPAPALLARRRTAAALRTFYDRIATDVADPVRPLPVGLAQLVEAIEPEEREAWLARAGHDEPPVADPLFPLPVGRAQARILARLGRDSGVVVEGPPGTGKTHTIANLLCALLAEGRRVLVTSEKAQALRVLRDKLPPAMRDLCVSLADPAAGDGTELSASIGALAAAATEFDPEESDRRVAELAERRRVLIEQRDRALDALVAARGAEAVSHGEVAPGFAGTRARIARRVRETRARDGWLAELVDTSRVLPRDPPCTASELRELAQLRTRGVPLGRGAEQDDDPTRGGAGAGPYFPPPVEMPPETHVADLADTIERGAAAATGRRGAMVAALSALPPAAAHHLPAVCRRIADAVVELENTGEDHEWARDVADGVLSGRAAHLWSRAVEQLGAVDDLLEHDREVGGLQVRVDDAVDPTSAAASFERYATWLGEGHTPRRMFKDAVQKDIEPLLDGVAVHGGGDSALASAAGARAAAHHLRMLEITDRLTEAFAPLGYRLRRMEHRPLLVEQALVLRSTCLQVGAVLTAAGQLRAVLAALPAVRRPRVDSLEVVETASTVTRGVDHVRGAELARGELDEIVARIEGGVPAGRQAAEVRRLVAALRALDADAYATALVDVDSARGEQHDRLRVSRLAAPLGATAPRLLAALDETPPGEIDWAARAARLTEAWAHARATAWLGLADAPSDGGHPGHHTGGDTARPLPDVEADLAAVTGALTAARAWRACLARTTAEQTRALQSHRTSLAAIGRGSGRYAEHYRRAALDAVEVARDAVPAWVMPIREVLATITPQRDAFDVVVVDEASQADLTSLFLLWLAPRVIVVGDDRQCTPAEVGIGSLEPAFARLESDLPDVPSYLRSQFTPRSSVFSVFRTTFGPPIRLREHFRSMPEIVSWPSQEFYAEEPLVPLRRFGADRLPPLRSTFVPGAANRGSGSALANPDEAAAIVDAVVACDAEAAYDDATFGVVVLQGHGQVELVDALLRARLGPARWEARRLRVGVPADFQGDERSVVWLSMVVAPGHRLVALTADRYRQGFNVAASRARDQLWVFHSVVADSLSGIDLRRRLLEYVAAPGGQRPPVGPSAPRPAAPTDRRDPAFASLFAQQVHAELTGRGFAVAPRDATDATDATDGLARPGLDLVVTGATGQVGVICESDAHATAPTRADVEREQELRRYGWPVLRCRESDHVLDPSTALVGLLADLAALGVAGAQHPAPITVRDTAPEPEPSGTRAVYAPRSGIPDALDGLLDELAEDGLPGPRRGARIQDPHDGSLLCTADALWPTGISRRALAAPVVLVREADDEVRARLGSLGYRVLVSVAEVRAHARPGDRAGGNGA